MSSRLLQKRLQNAITQALLQASHKAASIYVPPTNSRGYMCAASACQRPAYAKGLCNAHYLRFRNGRDMELPVRARKRGDLCAKCYLPTGAKGGWGLCRSHYKQERYAVIKDALITEMGGACSKCQGVFHRSAFDFHHKCSKQDSPARLLAIGSPDSIAAEIKQCVLLCANCHRTEHHSEL